MGAPQKTAPQASAAVTPPQPPAAAPASPAAPAPVRQVAATPPAEPAASVDSLIAQLRSGELTDRIEAAKKLAALASSAGTAALVSVLRDPTAEVAREAALALGAAKHASATADLAAVLLNHDGYFHASVRAAAAESLGVIGDPATVDTLIQSVRDPFMEPSQAAVRALGQLAHARAVEPLVAVLRNADAFFLPPVRLAAIETLGRFPAPAARAALHEVAENPAEDASFRHAANNALMN